MGNDQLSGSGNKEIKGHHKKQATIFIDIVLLIVVAGGVIFLIFNWNGSSIIK